MKKILLLLTLIFLLVTAVACGGNRETSSDKIENTTPNTTTVAASSSTTKQEEVTTAKPEVTTEKPEITTTEKPVVTTAPEPVEPTPTYSSDLALSYNWSQKANEIVGIGGCKDDVIMIPPKDDDGTKIYRIKSLTCDATTIIVPAGVTQIATGAFANCPNLEKVVLPATLIAVGEHLFENCPKLQTVEMETNSKFTVKNGCLIEIATKKVTSGTAFATIPDDGSVTAIGYAAFMNLPFSSFTIPEGVKEISDYAFSGCAKLQNVTLPDSLSMIGNKVFEGTPLHTDRTNWENGVLYVGNHLIEADRSLTEITLPENLVSIASNAFEGGNLKTISLPASVKGIGNNAFYQSQLETIDMNAGLTVIGYQAFMNTKIKTFIIPESVTTVGFLALGSLGLEHIYCYAETIPEGWDVTFTETTSWVTMGYNGEPIA